MQIDLSGRTALVTGSTRGIGRAIAQRLSDCGANVGIVGRDVSKAEMVATTLKSAKGFGCDVGDASAVAALVEEVEKAFTGIDILVNNAGITKDNLLMRIKDDDWDAVLNANLKAAFVATKAATRGMMKRRWGRVINIASVVGITGNKGQANYAASKAGLIGFTKSVAKELASRNILSNVVAPGFIETDMTANLPQQVKDGVLGLMAVKRLGNGDDIAATVAAMP